MVLRRCGFVDGTTTQVTLGAAYEFLLRLKLLTAAHPFTEPRQSMLSSEWAQPAATVQRLATQIPPIAFPRLRCGVVRSQARRRFFSDLRNRIIGRDLEKLP